ncbi:hypothetical protein [Nonomuraea rubra]|uniref:hypothetical protein n=1 Tax=Nonomuraea rubra TaxID=46180 RepID=UPI0031ED60CD
MMLLLALLLAWLAARHPILRDERTRARLIGVAALGYVGLVALVTWQALRAQPLTSPDLLTLGAAALLAGLTTVACGAVLTAARRGGGLATPADARRGGETVTGAGPGRSTTPLAMTLPPAEELPLPDRVVRAGLLEVPDHDRAVPQVLVRVRIHEDLVPQVALVHPVQRHPRPPGQVRGPGLVPDAGDLRQGAVHGRAECAGQHGVPHALHDVLEGRTCAAAPGSAAAPWRGRRAVPPGAGHAGRRPPRTHWRAGRPGRSAARAGTGRSPRTRSRPPPSAPRPPGSGGTASIARSARRHSSCVLVLVFDCWRTSGS